MTENKCASLTFRHDVMHGYRQEEDGITVVSPRASAEVLLHGLHNRKELLRKSFNVMKQHLQEDQHIGNQSVQQRRHKRSAASNRNNMNGK